MRGRLAETFGGDGNAGQKRIEHDTRIRTLGYARHAESVLANAGFPAATKARLEAYAAGVNAYVQSAGFALPQVFADNGIGSFDPWTAADSMLAWERVRETFNGTGMQAELDNMLACEGSGCTTPICDFPIDDGCRSSMTPKKLRDPKRLT
jgi:acyl-homoserine lactone acylase PvdQ